MRQEATREQSRGDERGDTRIPDEAKRDKRS